MDQQQLLSVSGSCNWKRHDASQASLKFRFWCRSRSRSQFWCSSWFRFRSKFWWPQLVFRIHHQQEASNSRATVRSRKSIFMCMSCHVVCECVLCTHVCVCVCVRAHWAVGHLLSFVLVRTFLWTHEWASRAQSGHRKPGAALRTGSHDHCLGDLTHPLGEVLVMKACTPPGRSSVFAPEALKWRSSPDHSWSSSACSCPCWTCEGAGLKGSLLIGSWWAAGVKDTDVTDRPTKRSNYRPEVPSSQVGALLVSTIFLLLMIMNPEVLLMVMWL